MRKASDFLSKPVISLKEGRDEGIIKNISFSTGLTAAEWLVLYDENDLDCDEKAVAVGHAFVLGENAVMIKSGQAVVPAVSAPLCENNPINCRVFTAEGKLLGIVSDVLLTDKNTVTSLVYGKDKQLPLSQVLSSSRDVVVAASGEITAGVPEVPAKQVPAPRPADAKRKVKALSGKDKAEKEKTAPDKERIAAEKKPAEETPGKEKITEETAAVKDKENDKKEKSIAELKEQIRTELPERAAAAQGINEKAAAKEAKPAPAKKKVKKNSVPAEKTAAQAITQESKPAEIKTIRAEEIILFPAATAAGKSAAYTAESAGVKDAPVTVTPAAAPEAATPATAIPASAAATAPAATPAPAPAAAPAVKPATAAVFDTADATKTAAPEAEGAPVLGIAVPIKKNSNPAVQPVTAYQIQPAQEPPAVFAYDSGERIEIWPLELEHIPERIIASYSFLLGRRVSKNIYNASRELVIRADTLVSTKTVETARKYGRLVDLTKLSDFNG